MRFIGIKKLFTKTRDYAAETCRKEEKNEKSKTKEEINFASNLITRIINI